MAHLVVTLLCPGANPFEFGVSCEIFGLRRPELDVEWYEHQLAACSRPLVVNGGWTIDSCHGLEALDGADTVVVPACPMEPPQAAVSALRRAYDRGARMVSFCSGAFALAAAGILDGRRATTHWMYADDLARRHPRVAFDPDVLVTQLAEFLAIFHAIGTVEVPDAEATDELARALPYALDAAETAEPEAEPSDEDESDDA
jgi:AraC family transcriptional activator FtrA